jgi:hypothetical protein
MPHALPDSRLQNQTGHKQKKTLYLVHIKQEISINKRHSIQIYLCNIKLQNQTGKAAGCKILQAAKSNRKSGA